MIDRAKLGIMSLLRRAQIHREGGDVTMAIVNYTQAIKLDPEDYEAYYQRAEMYEKVIFLYVCVCEMLVKH